MATNKEIADRIVTGLLRKSNTYSALEARAKELNIEMHQFDEAMALVHKDKRIKQTTRGEEIYYTKTPVKKPKGPGSHIKWLNDNYPRYEYDMPFPEIDMSWIILSPEEMKQFKAEQSGRTFIPQKRYRKKQ